MRKNSIVWPRDIADDPVSLVFEAIETLYANYQSSQSDRLEIFWNDWSDRDDHMETKL